MNRCGLCKKWNQNQQIFHDDIYGVCQGIKAAAESEEIVADAYIGDCLEGVYHSFHTKNTFCCILFEEK